MLLFSDDLKNFKFFKIDDSRNEENDEEMQDVDNHNENEASNEMEDDASNNEEDNCQEAFSQDKTINAVNVEGYGQNLENKDFEETYHSKNGITYHIMKTDIIKGTK